MKNIVNWSIKDGDYVRKEENTTTYFKKIRKKQRLFMFVKAVFFIAFITITALIIIK